MINYGVYGSCLMVISFRGEGRIQAEIKVVDPFIEDFQYFINRILTVILLAFHQIP